MQKFKDIIGIVAVILTFVGYVPYVIDTIKGKTKPHVYSWFLWGFLTAIAFALQVSGKAGAGSLVTLASALIFFVIFGLGMRGGKKDINKADTIFFIIALIAVIVWLFAKQPVLSILLITAINTLGMIPTVRKSWKEPFSETLFTWLLNTFRNLLSIFALQNYSILTWLFPISLLLENGLFSLLLIIRRKEMIKLK